MEKQGIECKIGFTATTGIGEFRDDCVLEVGRRVADFSEAVNSSGSREAVRNMLDAIKRALCPDTIRSVSGAALKALPHPS
jgi:hypothetical protein